MNASLQQRLEGSPLDAVLQLAAFRRAQGFANDGRARMQPWLRAARRRYRIARELRSDDRVAVALSLLQAATQLALRALHVAHAGDARPESETDAWAIVERAREYEIVPAALERVRASFEHVDALRFDSLTVEEARALRDDAEQVLAFLCALAEPREPRQIRRSRWMRAVLAGFVLLVVLMAFIAYAAVLRSIAPHGGG
ncbi:MAG TPA: HEPN domain-containing protein [Polyangiaceae bacterium]|jgi:HEPN domain-containing protein